jgi:hypothetical protein
MGALAGTFEPITKRGGGAGRPPGPASEDVARYNKARADTQEEIARIKATAAKTAAIELDVRRGQLVASSDVEAVVSEFVGIVVTFLAPLADRLGRDCGLKGSVVEKIQTEVDVVRTELQALLERKFDRG